MANCVALWTLDNEASMTDLFDKVMVLQSETLAILQVHLKADKVLDWPF